MASRIPNGIARAHLVEAIRALEAGEPHPFSPSTGYRVFHDGKRYPPKAVVGIGAREVTGRQLSTDDFRGGFGTRCFRIFQANGFEIITKADTEPFPDEVPRGSCSVEGALESVQVNRFERDPQARRQCIAHYGPKCSVRALEFGAAYGEIGRGFIHEHNLVPLSTIGHEYVVDPIRDLRPVCPNCHAMLHKRTPPYRIEELRVINEVKVPPMVASSRP